jgi:uncharacterized membrane protein YvbJ
VVFCAKCGNEETSDKSFCSKCGAALAVNPNSGETARPYQTRKSRWWYLLPIFFGIIGGIIAYLIVKNDDRPLAKNCLYLGIILTVVEFVIGFIYGAMAAMMSYY